MIFGDFCGGDLRISRAGDVYHTGGRERGIETGMGYNTALQMLVYWEVFLSSNMLIPPKYFFFFLFLFLNTEI